MPKFTALPTDIVRAYQNGEPDAYGNPAEHAVSDGVGKPCRHCLRDVSKGCLSLPTDRLTGCIPMRKPDRSFYVRIHVCAGQQTKSHRSS